MGPGDFTVGLAGLAGLFLAGGKTAAGWGLGRGQNQHQLQETGIGLPGGGGAWGVAPITQFLSHEFGKKICHIRRRQHHLGPLKEQRKSPEQATQL